MHPAVIKSGQVIAQKYQNIHPETKRRARNVIVILILLLIFKNRLQGLFSRIFHRDISKVDVNHSNLTYDRGEYYSMCSTLESAMDGAGTKEDSVMDVMMRLQTQDDWNFLQKTFGIRKKKGGLFYRDVTGDLKMWLSDDLTGRELEEVRDTLRQHGISF